MRALERYQERSTGSIAVTKWLASAVLGVTLAAAAGVWRTVVVSEARIEAIEERAIGERQDIASIESRITGLPTLAVRLDQLAQSNSELKLALAEHSKLRRHVP